MNTIFALSAVDGGITTEVLSGWQGSQRVTIVVVGTHLPWQKELERIHFTNVDQALKFAEEVAS